MTSTSTSTTTLSLLTEPMLAGGLLLLYNAVTGSGISQETITDAVYLAASDLASNVIANLFFSSSTTSSLFGTSTAMIESNFIVPILSSMMYSCAYDNYYRKSFNSSGNRSSNMNYLISFAAAYVASAYETPLYSFLTTSL